MMPVYHELNKSVTICLDKVNNNINISPFLFWGAHFRDAFFNNPRQNILAALLEEIEFQ